VVKTQLGLSLVAEGKLKDTGQRMRVSKRLIASAATLVLAACAANGDPGAAPLAGGQSCQTIRADLNRLDSKGVPALVERQNAGKKLSKSQKAQADLYNRRLNEYLGARCHV
jgi:hypothetical protein